MSRANWVLLADFLFVLYLAVFWWALRRYKEVDEWPEAFPDSDSTPHPTHGKWPTV